MASVTSLGLHKPIGLPYLIQEGLVSTDPPPDEYTWELVESDDNGGDYDELLNTRNCVVWSSGGVVRKSFRLDIEEEPISQVLLTTFASSQPTLPRTPHIKSGTLEDDRSASTNSCFHGIRNRAIVVFLKTQAHIFFLSGTSHVIHLPFEIECALAAPNGFIVQRKPNLGRTIASSVRLPPVPNNSFVPTQAQSWSATSSIQSTFSTASLGSPRQLALPDSTLLNSVWGTPHPKDDTKWPRLFCITDPLMDLGLIATSTKYRHAEKTARSGALDPAEEIMHITRLGDLGTLQECSQTPVILAVTLNRETSQYTIWKVKYVEQEDISKRRPATMSKSESRRRSSFMPTSGASTPAVNDHYGGREGLNTLGLPGVYRPRLDLKEDILDLAAEMDPAFEDKALPRRRSRRVSSMVARADLSGAHSGPGYHELSASQHSMQRRGESLGSQYGRTSVGQTGANSRAAPAQFGASIGSLNSFLEAPVDDLLDELRAGGDFEGFHNMGLEDEDFDGLRKEIEFTKIESIPIQMNNVRFSASSEAAHSQHRIFTLVAPRCASEDPRKCDIVVCILDKIEKTLVVVTLDTKKRVAQATPARTARSRNQDDDDILIKLSHLKRAKRVLDACRLGDGDYTRMLILTESSDGQGDLTLQAPWSHLMQLELPSSMAVTNIHDLSHDATPQKRREGGIRRVLSSAIRSVRSLRHTGPHGIVDIEDEEGRLHRLKVIMSPCHPLVKKTLDICRSVLPGSRGGEGVLVAWWHAQQWLRSKHPEENNEWTAIVLVLFSLVLGFQEIEDAPLPSRMPQTSRAHMRSPSQDNDYNWRRLMSGIYGGASASTSCSNPAWEWLHEQDVLIPSQQKRTPRTNESSVEDMHALDANQRLVRLSRLFTASEPGQAALSELADRPGYLPTARHRTFDFRVAAVSDLLTGLHLLREEQKLDIATTDSAITSHGGLASVLAQLFRWIGWTTWATFHDYDNLAMANLQFESGILVNIPQPANPPDVLMWIESCFVAKQLGSFVNIVDITLSRSIIGHQDAPDSEQWALLTPRTSLFMRFFSTIAPDSTAAALVEALHQAGMTSSILDSLPEAVMIPLRNCIASCQAQPSASWDSRSLSLVDREDVNLLLSPESQKHRVFSSILAPTHEASNDIHTTCLSTQDVETVGSFDGSAEVDRQAISRLIFKDDRRISEAAGILNTTKPKIARVETQPEWSESDILEAQKEHVQMLATRTLAIPTGRGLLYFSARIPLLTEKFPISGFNLHCIMKPSNNTIAVDRNNFSEEKVCWAFFHSGVAAGLSISRDAKGIDTSWIIYNKPSDLGNRHAGFLLALGLNGHLKSVAKWVAFKYLTPKHTMTSIGLLLGLATSYLGTMDSLITRLLSVHVTRMLPPGAAELNLSPLTQTAGILGIGILYCNTQHRRMSEIMLSEVEHMDPELEDEPLRNEGYRLASGFALGFINLGKGTDLKGLHDLRLQERLLRVAVGNKKVDLVHILDKSSAAAIVAIALIFMKSGNKSLAHKIDVPRSMLQYDYIRPDMFLLRTLARHLIMWSEIEASISWVRSRLPSDYQYKSDLRVVSALSSEDLPFYNILAGILFSIGLRYAGSGSGVVRDVMLHYLDQMSRVCRLSATSFDEKLTRTTVRNCVDLIALSTSAVMAGTGDLATFRRLRSLHGRDDPDTPYGSHLAAHIAIGALFLGGGTHTFGTSNLAVASLILSFYPLFPTNILDNRSHLQAFRHFWVLATEARCLVTRDIDTNMPVSVPLSITLKSGSQYAVHAPALLPDLDLIATVKIDSQDYWSIMLDFGGDERVRNVFGRNQAIWVRRRLANNSGSAVFQATLQALDAQSTAVASAKSSQPLEWLFTLDAFKSLTQAERALVLGPSDGAASAGLAMESTVVDAKLMLEKATLMSGKKDRLQGLKLLFAWKEACERRGEEMSWIRSSFIDGLRARVWLMSREHQGTGTAY